MNDHDFDIEPVKGLPETPPEGERILWQGSPDPWRFATRVYKLWWVVGYFLLLGLWRVVDFLDRGLGWAEALNSFAWFAGLAAILAAMLYGFGWATAKSAVYTITNRRVAMRIGIALTLTLNLPHQWIQSADMRVRRDRSGDIALSLKGESKIGYLVLWPHAQPWKINAPKPMFRAIREVEQVAAILGEAAQTRIAKLEASGAMPDAGASPVAAE
ncbi:MAG: photosynthetic complex putative assembly protein PuhB [Rubricella sp.]